jgi:hypothetical protein
MFGSSISTSAPPPIRPIVVIELVISNSPPCEGPSTTKRLICSPLGSLGFAASGNGASDNPMALGLSRGSDEITLIVGAPGLEGKERCSIVELHIQQVIADEGSLSE